MKQLDLPQPLLLITIGYPGAGKSSFAKQLAKSYDFAWVHANYLRHSLFAHPSFSREEEECVGMITDYMLRELLRGHGNIIFDANANPQIARAKIIKQARDAGFRVLTVWIQTDLETAKLRASKRTGRRQDDEFNAIAYTTQQFEHFAKQLARPMTSESYVVISGKHAYPTQIRTLLTKIEELYRPAKPHAAKPEAKREIRQVKEIMPPKRDQLPSVEDIHRAAAPKPKERSRPRFDITRHIKFR
ncbi:MAG TPA: ATP-binding protein [Candidatus Saccharimonadales bacterium]|nr:ATP-binding protein [Candidatus Saccharimonadales bacterium]